MPLSMEQELARLQVQERDDDCGGTINEGLAENTQEGRSIGGGVTVNVRGLEVPPPGVGVATVTGYAPAAATSDAGIDALSCVVDANEVVLATPLKLITDEGTKLVPLTVSVSPVPVVVSLGETLVIVGAGYRTVNTLLSPDAIYVGATELVGRCVSPNHASEGV